MIYTKREKVEGQVSVWAVPKSNYELKREKEAAPDSVPRPFNFVLMSEPGRRWETGAVKVQTFDASFVIDGGINLVEKALETLNDEKKVAYDEYAKKLKELDAAIDRLKLLEHMVPDDGEYVNG